jgi:hypothetical protein
MSQSATATSIPAKRAGNSLAQTLLHIAWLSIFIGLGLELVMLVIAAYSNKLPGIDPIIANLVQKISWSGLVCTGLAFGKAASNGSPTWMSFAGLLSAPSALAVARALHKSTSHALKVAEAGVTAAFPFFVAGLKGLEYAVLGLILGWIGRRASSGLISYASGGLIIGLVFGTAIAGLSTPEGFSTVKIIPPLVNEVLFPVGCSLAIFAADAIGKQTLNKPAVSADD